MSALKQGDFIKVAGFNNAFIVVSNNAFIEATDYIHVCPLIEKAAPGPLHLPVTGSVKKTQGTVIVEQIKLLDTKVRFCSKFDRAYEEDIMNIQDAVQCMFEYE